VIAVEGSSDVTIDTDNSEPVGAGAVTFKSTSTTNGAFALSIDTSATGAETKVWRGGPWG